MSIPVSHPALPGHFPGQPLVPGVVLLDCALAEAESWLNTRLNVIALSQAKFTAPLLPQQCADLELTLTGVDLRFMLERDAITIAQGVFKLAEAPA